LHIAKKLSQKVFKTTQKTLAIWLYCVLYSVCSSPLQTIKYRAKDNEIMQTKTTTNKTATRKKRLANAETQKAVTASTHASDKIITLDNAHELAQRFTIRTFKTLISNYAMPYYHELYYSLCADIRHINTPPHKQTANYTLSDAYDIVQTASIAILQYLNKPLNLVLRIETKVKKGVTIEKPVTIKLDIFRSINNYIMSLRAVAFKKNVNVDDYNGNEIKVPFKWDIDTYTDFTRITAILDNLNLTDRQDKILKYRLRGLSVKAIAKYIGVSRQSIMKTMKQIQDKLPLEYQEQGKKLIENTNRRELLRQARKANA